MTRSNVLVCTAVFPKLLAKTELMSVFASVVSGHYTNNYRFLWPTKYLLDLLQKQCGQIRPLDLIGP